MVGRPAPPPDRSLVDPLAPLAMSALLDARISARRPEAGTVLIADDDADMRLYLRGCLRIAGVGEILEAADGREALRLARSARPALIISDVLMPGLDGGALCRALKADPQTRAIPFLLISGETLAPPPCTDGFLPKPFNMATLRAHVRPLLERSS